MYIKNLALLTAALSAGAAADFVVITTTPTPTNLAVLANLSSWVSSIESYVTSNLYSLTASVAPSAASHAASMQSKFVEFAATASYSIPAAVTQMSGAYETFTTVPAWYSALPSDVKSYYDTNNKVVESLVLEAVNGKTTGSASVTGASATAAQTTAQATGAGSVVKAVGAGVAAMVAGVMVL
ncbi:hypothetical protein P153DRAFT_126401 [Dothidotthia symphoricarpi CBS 119687]|uniref:Uncharacterized protein n=1 Tax=Dothidotthia symphoricarpi CBS 119687 TaxID=1392245 RepID=A0A6A6A1A4_9PLEO|nr:uncharacterized protein P153DRAFT_126401 [Dothidotthia symphoricarpi CBS 119687]KAF2124747.1 hypothetical protein P153DRAFT_126401 [Dothidotthia symphoricarpi CBS 119687]